MNEIQGMRFTANDKSQAGENMPELCLNSASSPAWSSFGNCFGKLEVWAKSGGEYACVCALVCIIIYILYASRQQLCKVVNIYPFYK